MPTLFFIDPFGYKGLSLDLIGNAIRSWGCDCIFFFNYNRINPGLTNPSVPECMNDLFGPERAERLRTQVRYLVPDVRETTIIRELTDALKEVGGNFVLPFRFQSLHGDRTSHYIVFVSKAFRGYHIMKEVMWGESTDTGDVKGFEYIPVRSTQIALFPDFGKDHSLQILKEVLTSTFRGKSMSVVGIYECITPDTPYTLKNVKDALLELELEHQAMVDRPPAKRMRFGKLTLGNERIVSFSP